VSEVTVQPGGELQIQREPFGPLDPDAWRASLAEDPSAVIRQLSELPGTGALEEPTGPAGASHVENLIKAGTLRRAPGPAKRPAWTRAGRPYGAPSGRRRR
jgi:hypothetical protein